jgi:hypothetical protein
MSKSEQINELATALAKAQGELGNGGHPEIETAPLVCLADAMRQMAFGVSKGMIYHIAKGRAWKGATA